MQTANSLQKTLMLGKTEGRKRRGQQKMRWLHGITDSMDVEFEQTLGHSEGQESLACWCPGGLKELDTTEWLTTTTTLHLGGKNLSNLESIGQKLIQFSSVAQLYPTLCDPMDCSTPGLPVHRQLPEFTQTHVHWVSGAIQSSSPLLSPSPPAFSLSQH